MLKLRMMVKCLQELTRKLDSQKISKMSLSVDLSILTLSKTLQNVLIKTYDGTCKQETDTFKTRTTFMMKLGITIKCL